MDEFDTELPIHMDNSNSDIFVGISVDTSMACLKDYMSVCRSFFAFNFVFGIV